MSDRPFEPCPEWAEKLAMNHVDDLSLSNVSALENHLETCPACAKARTEYAATRQLIHDLPQLDESSPELPSWLQRMVTHQMHMGRGGPSRVQKAVCFTTASRKQSVIRAISREIE